MPVKQRDAIPSKQASLPLEKKIAFITRQGELPMALTERMKAKLISYLCCIHSIWKILFVCKHKQDSISQLVLSPNI